MGFKVALPCADVKERHFELNVKVIKARNLNPSDSDGLSDPYAALTMEGKGNECVVRVTNYIQRTLDPIWNESFSFVIDGFHKKLGFCVCDYDPAETLGSKVRKLKGMKGFKGATKFFQELFMHDENHEHVGWNEIHLQSIPPTGLVKWFNLLNKSESPNGQIKLELGFSSETKNPAAFEEYRRLFRLIITYEIQHENLEPMTWRGDLKDSAALILRQFIVHNGLEHAQIELAKWIELTEMHVHQPFNYCLFLDILSIIIVYHGNGRYSNREKEMFSKGARRLLDSIFKEIGEQNSNSDPSTLLCDLLRVMPEFTLGRESSTITPENHTIFEHVSDLIIESASQWFANLAAAHKLDRLTHTKDDLRNAAKLVNEVNGKLERSILHFDGEFSTINMSYTLQTFRVYDKKMLHAVSSLYADEIISRGKTAPQADGQRSVFVTRAMITNDVLFVKDAIEPLMKDVLGNISENDQAKRFGLAIIRNSQDDLHSRVLSNMDDLGNDMSTIIKGLLEDHVITTEYADPPMLAEFLQSSVSDLEKYLDRENYKMVIRKLWEAVCDIVNDTASVFLVRHGIQAAFKRLTETFDHLVIFFKSCDVDIELGESFVRVKEALSFQMQTTPELIHRYRLMRMSESTSNLLKPHGTLVVKLSVVHSTDGNRRISVNILNCRNLTPHDKNGTCDPYVTIRFLPRELFPGVTDLRTEVQKNTLFAIFDESFVMDYNADQAETETALIHFAILDKDILTADFIAEAFFPVADIPNREGEQMHLTITKPNNEDCKILRILESRKGDKMARTFVKEERSKMKLKDYHEPY